jgi:hypothetical protein
MIAEREGQSRVAAEAGPRRGEGPEAAAGVPRGEGGEAGTSARGGEADADDD